GQGRLEPLLRAVEVFGFHLAVLDLRQNADVHERVVAELLERVAVAGEYAALSELERVQLLARELAGSRLLLSPYFQYSAQTGSELAILREAAQIHARFGPEERPNYV